MNISAVLPIHNGSKWIERNLPRIQNSLSSSDELVIVENGSTDDTFKKLNKFVQEDSRIRLLHLSKAGLVSALNTGIRESANNWIARYDIDDVYLETRLRYQRNLIGEEISAVFSDYQFCSSRGFPLGIVPSPISNPATKASLVNSERTAHPTALLNRHAVLAAGGYRDEEFPAEDLGMWARLASLGKLLSAPSVSVKYRLQKSSVSSTNNDFIKKLTLDLVEKYKLSKWTKLAIDSFEETIFEYQGYRYGQARTLLHIRDILSPVVLDSISSDRARLIKSYGKKLLYNPSYTLSAVSLVQNKLVRDLYRAIS